METKGARLQRLLTRVNRLFRGADGDNELGIIRKIRNLAGRVRS